MKLRILILSLLLSLVSLPILLTQTGCSGSPSSPGATPTPTEVFNWGGAGTYLYTTDGSPSNTAYARIRANGATIINAGVTLTDGTTSWPMVYTTYSVLDGPVTYSEYDTTTFTSYTPGATYKITATVLGQSSAVSGVAPGGQTLFIDGTTSAVTQITWTHSGPNDSIYIHEYSPTAQFPFSQSGSLTSPLDLSTHYPDTGSLASYQVHMINANHPTDVLNGTFDGGTYYNLYDESSQGVTFP